MDTMYFTVKPKSPAAEVVAKLLAKSREQTQHAYRVLKAAGIPMTKKFSVCSLQERVVGFGHEDPAFMKDFIAKNGVWWKSSYGYAMPNHKTPEGRALKKTLAAIPKDITREEVDLALTGSSKIAMGLIPGPGGGFFIPHVSLWSTHSGKVKPLIGIPTPMVKARKATLVKGLVEITQSAVFKLKAQHEKAG